MNKEILEYRHAARLIWTDCLEAETTDGNEARCYVDCSATLHDCINRNRFVRYIIGLPVGISDWEMLQDFVKAHGARYDLSSLPKGAIVNGTVQTRRYLDGDVPPDHGLDQINGPLAGGEEEL